MGMTFFADSERGGWVLLESLLKFQSPIVN